MIEDKIMIGLLVGIWFVGMAGMLLRPWEWKFRNDL